MSAVFVDSFYFIAYLNERDADHQRAVTFSASYTGAMVTSCWIITELADAFADRARRDQVISLIGKLREDPKLRVVPPTQELFERGWPLYSDRPDKDWSLTDCISFVVMQDEGLTEALTGDHHFEQAGFKPLLA